MVLSADGQPKGLLRFAGRFAISFAIILAIWAVLLWQIDFSRLAEILRASRWPYLLWMALASVAAIGFRAWRLKLLLACDARFAPVFHAENISYLVNVILPLRAGEMALALALRKVVSTDGSRALAAVAVDRMLDLIIVLILFAAVLMVAPPVPASIRGGAASLAVVVAVATAIMFAFPSCKAVALHFGERIIGKFPRADHDIWLRRIDSFLQGFQSLRDPRALFPALILTLAVWAATAAAYYLAIAAFWDSPDIIAVVFTMCVATFGISTVAVPSGMGIFHASVVIGFAVFSVPQEASLAMALIYHGAAVVIAVVLGIHGLRRCGFGLSTVLSTLK